MVTGKPGVSPGVTSPALARSWSMRTTPSTAKRLPGMEARMHNNTIRCHEEFMIMLLLLVVIRYELVKNRGEVVSGKRKRLPLTDRDLAPHAYTCEIRRWI